MGLTRVGGVRVGVVALLATAMVVLGSTQKVTRDWFGPRPENDPEPVTISGDAVTTLSPGTMVPLDLRLYNPNDFAITINEITVAVHRVDAARADAGHPCAVDDFEVRQASEDVVLKLAGERVHDLMEMGLARDSWPAVGLLNRSVNQDGCKGALVTLAYEARGVEVQR